MSVCAVMRNYDVEDRGFETPCWVWHGTVRKGKAIAWISGEYVYVHRHLWTEVRGDVLESSTLLMRQCAEVRCVNPDHYRYSRRVLGLPPREPSTPEQQRRWNLQKYGITPEMFDALLEAQGGTCGACPRTDSGDRLGRTLHVDHDHLTGVVRGLLCSRCNNAIGQADESPTRLRELALYLERS